jgi:hypothetical protein
MGRKLRTTVPITTDLLHPKLPDYSLIADKEALSRQKQKKTFDSRHNAREPRVFTQGDTVWIPDMKTSGKVQNQVSARSYEVATPLGSLRRNRQHLRPVPQLFTFNADMDTIPENDCVSPNPPNTLSTEALSTPLSPTEATSVYKTRSGRASVAPDRYRAT